jgi:hypothetical protein
MKNRVLIWFFVILSLWFSNGFINHHFYLSFISTLVSFLFYIFAALLIFWFINKDKKYRVIFFFTFCFSVILFLFSEFIAIKQVDWNKKRVESLPKKDLYVFYGIYPSKPIRTNNCKEIYIKGLYGEYHIYSLETQEWRIED